MTIPITSSAKALRVKFNTKVYIAKETKQARYKI